MTICAVVFDAARIHHSIYDFEYTDDYYKTHTPTTISDEVKLETLRAHGGVALL